MAEADDRDDRIEKLLADIEADIEADVLRLILVERLNKALKELRKEKFGEFVCH